MQYLCTKNKYSAFSQLTIIENATSSTEQLHKPHYEYTRFLQVKVQIVCWYVGGMYVRLEVKTIQF